MQGVRDVAVAVQLLGSPPSSPHPKPSPIDRSRSYPA
jgi:hypothetical protein